VGTKLHLGVSPEGGDWRIPGFDAASVVEAAGTEAQNFEPGDTVFYAGATRGKIVLEGF